MKKLFFSLSAILLLLSCSDETNESNDLEQIQKKKSDVIEVVKIEEIPENASAKRIRDEQVEEITLLEHNEIGLNGTIKVSARGGVSKHKSDLGITFRRKFTELIARIYYGETSKPINLNLKSSPGGFFFTDFDDDDFRDVPYTSNTRWQSGKVFKHILNGPLTRGSYQKYYDLKPSDLPVFPFTTAWNNTDHVRTLADVNGDGKADIVGFGNNGVVVSLSNGADFETPQIWSTGFTDSWDNSRHVRTLADVNGDGKDDIIGFGDNGVTVSLSNGNSFDSPQSWINHFGYNSSAGGWKSNNPRTVADVNGDGMADIIGFGNNHVIVSLSNGSSFGSRNRWIDHFGYNSNAGSWNSNTPRVVADVNGDGKADIVGFGNNHVIVSLSNGSSFGIRKRWIDHFGYNSNAGGWNSNNPRTLADVNGDGKADIVGFGNNHVIVSLSNGSSFESQKRWINDFGYNSTAGGWGSNHPRTVDDFNGDGMADIIGFGNDNVLLSQSNGSKFEVTKKAF